jgi:hypothetical protein
MVQLPRILNAFFPFLPATAIPSGGFWFGED